MEVFAQEKGLAFNLRMSTKFFALFVSLACVGLAATSAFGIDPTFEPMTFSVNSDPCGGGNADHCAPHLLAIGQITAQTPSQLQTALATGIRRVYWHSPGGNLMAGMEMGRILRRAQAETYIDAGPYVTYAWRLGRSVEKSLVTQPLCVSACAFAFMGGAVRQIGDGSRFGLHQFKSVKGDGGESMAQAVSAALAIYLDEMGVDRRTLDYALLTPSGTMTYLTQPVLARLRVDNTSAITGKWEISATDQGQPYVKISQTRSDAHTVNLSISRDIQGYVLFVGFSASLPRLSRTLRDVKAIYADAPVSGELLVDGKRFALNHRSPWQYIQRANTFLIAYHLPPNVAAAIATAKAIEYDANFARAIRDVDPSLSVGTSGLRAGMSILAR